MLAYHARCLHPLHAWQLPVGNVRKPYYYTEVVFLSSSELSLRSYGSGWMYGSTLCWHPCRVCVREAFWFVRAVFLPSKRTCPKVSITHNLNILPLPRGYSLSIYIRCARPRHQTPGSTCEWLQKGPLVPRLTDHAHNFSFKKNLNASKPSEHPPQVEECLKV